MMTTGQTAHNSADGYDVGVVREAVPAISSWLEYQRTVLRTPGIQVAIAVDGELVHSEALGYADEPAGMPLRTDHLFRIASHSKTFTATSILQLAERSKIRLDDPISTWVPELVDSPIATVTVRELLGHQGGVIRDGVDTDFWQLMRPFPDKDELLELCRQHGRVFAPNEHFKYTNVGYSLLGLVIEAAGGSSYADYVTEHIIKPLGLQNTGPEYDPARSADYAAGHSGLLDGQDTRQAIGHVDTRSMAAATGFYSTAEDLTRYGAAHFHGSDALLSEASKRLMQRNESTVVEHGKEQGRYGLGLDLTRIGEREWIGHSGGYPGHITRTYVDPRGRVVVSVLTNCIGGPATQLAQGVIKLLDLAHAAPRRVGVQESGEASERAEVPERIDLQSFTGRFASLMGVLDIALLGGRLVAFAGAAEDPTDSWDELQVVDADTLLITPAPGYGGAGESIDYVRDGAGAVSMIRTGGGSRWPVEVFRQRRSAQIAGLAG